MTSVGHCAVNRAFAARRLYCLFILNNYCHHNRRMCAHLPVSIDPCPIVDATVELRFETKVPGPVIVGLAYERLKQLFPKISQLQNFPIIEELRKLNPAIIYQPDVRFESEGFVALLGARVFAVGVNGPYTKWALVSQAFSEALDRFKESNLNLVPEP